jgi:hypothetical protein
MRKLLVSITAASLALSMLAQSAPAAAVAGFDSAYAGESAFVALAPGQSNEFQVFFANTGSITWTRGTTSQVDLATCLSDKVTCNAQDTSDAPWNSGWLSSTRYATHTQTSVAPGAVATFRYTVMAPSGVAAGQYDFNGDLVLASTGEKIHPEGYFQAATVGAGAGAATITSLTPSSGTANGGTTVTIAGSGFVCTPSFPSVAFGSSLATVTSCGATSLTATSPAGAVGSVNVTVTNSGAAASNALSYTYVDTTHPVFQSFTVTNDLVTITWSEGVCRDVAFAASDWNVLNVSAPGANPVTGESTPACNAARDNLVTTSVLDLTTAMPPGAFVEVTLNATGTDTDGASANLGINDKAGNGALAPQARQATATTPETTRPTVTAISGAVGATSMTITFSEPVYCTGFVPATMITLTDNNSATTDPTVTGFGTNTCGTSTTTADGSFSVTLSSALPADRTYTVTIDQTAADQIQDIVGNDLADPTTATFTTGAGDFTPPTITDAKMVNNVGTSDFQEVGDSFSLTFSEAMNGTTTGVIQFQDQDGTIITPPGVTCGGNVSCSWNTAVTTITVTVTTALTTPAVGTGGAGSTPGMQIPFNITTLNGFADLQGNVPNVLGSTDRLVDYE